MKAQVFDSKGKKLPEIILEKEIFELEAKEALIKDAYVRYLSNRRENYAKAKTRAERRGGGKKPWRQKGTGRARTGSRRNPVWRKGGVIFGPTGIESYSKEMNKKQLRKALKMVLSKKAKDKKIIILDKIELTRPKTKEVVGIIENLPVEKKILLVSEENPVLLKSTENITDVTFTLFNQLNIFDALVSDFVVMTKKGYEKAVAFYKSKGRAPAKKKKPEKSKKKEKKSGKSKNKAQKQKKEDK